MESLLEINVNELSLHQKKEYYKELRKQCLSIRNSQFHFGQQLIQHIYPLLRNYSLEIEGQENIPKDSNAIFLVNHSNSHDIFTAYEVLSSLGRPASVMVATDCLNPITTGVFDISNATLLDRRNDAERKQALMVLSKKILEGSDGVVFGEGTWNLHPVWPMHNIHQGVSKISAITQAPVIPTIFEYIEKDGMFQSEQELYKKCLIRFEKPMMIHEDYNLIDQTNRLKETMIQLRTKIWKDYSILKNNLSNINPRIYVNHVYLKKFKALGFTYDSKKEQEFLLFLKHDLIENEYFISPEGEFLPGITEKMSKVKKIQKK